MGKTSKLVRSAIFLIIISTLCWPVFAQKNSKSSKQTKQIMWERVNVSQRDLFLGPGGKEMLPDLSQITFIKEEKGGSSKKFRIKDGKERVWVAKIGREAQPETVAVRLIWGLGYKTEINYLVPEMTIPGKGKFKNVRLEARPENVEREGRWAWKDNPFARTNELQGLKIMMAFLNNWDLKSKGNNIQLLVKTKKGREIHYAVSDLGATFGRTGYFDLPIIWRLGRSVNKPSAYSKSDFIDEVKKGRVDFSYKGGRNSDLFDDITIGEARWIADLLLQLTDEQIKAAFQAANYLPHENKILTAAVKGRISELDRATRATLAKNNE